MTGLDTNILVRYLTRDEPTQFETAREVIQGAEERGERLFLNAVVLCELSWVLKGGRYRLNRQQISDTIESLLRTSVFEVQYRDETLAAVREYREGPGDFADALIGRINGRAGCGTTVTLDTRLARLQSFEVLAHHDG